MITTLTVNPCIDRTSVIDKMVPDGLNIVLRSREDLGGKGINVSAALSNLGVDSTIVTWLFEENKEKMERFLSQKKLASDLIPAEGSLRVNLKIFEEVTQNMTEFNEKGTSISPEALACIEKSVLHHASTSKILVLSGSLCPNMPDDFYQRILQKSKAINPSLYTILDASNTPFMKGLQANPFLIKPNLYELETAFGASLTSPQDIIALSREIIAQGIPIVCVSMGSKGAILVSENKAYHITPPPLHVKSAQGAGDSMVAGLCYAILQDESPENMLRYGVAAASATIMQEGTQMGALLDFQNIYHSLSATKIS